MASQRRTVGTRREPVFDPDVVPGLRVRAERASSRETRRPAPVSTSSYGSPVRRRRRSGGGGRRGRSVLGRLVYWSLVLGVWGAISAVGAMIWVGAHLPPIQSLEIPKRPPTIHIVGLG